MFITEMGDSESQLLGMITSSDANVIDQYLIFQDSLAFYEKNSSLKQYFLLFYLNAMKKSKNYENCNSCNFGNCWVQFDFWQCDYVARERGREIVLFSILDKDEKES